jgi:hypothetical protein
VKGEMKQTIGIIGGAFTDVSKVTQVLEELSKLSPPQLIPDSSDAVSAATPPVGLVRLVEQKLTELVHRFVHACNPRNVYDTLILVPSLAMQAVAAAHHSVGDDLAKMLVELESVTRIIFKISNQREHTLLFRDLI